MEKILYTKFGKAQIRRGYYVITTSKEGNCSKPLHRLIYEDYHKITILPNNVVHHIDGDKLNNDINNLQLVSWGEHSKIHHKNKKISKQHKQTLLNSLIGNTWNQGRKHTSKAKKNMSEAQKGRIITDEHKINLSKSQNKTGYFRVSKEYGKQYKQGFRYRYIWREDGKRKEIKSVDLNKLKEKVIRKGLPWIKLEE